MKGLPWRGGLESISLNEGAALERRQICPLHRLLSGLMSSQTWAHQETGHGKSNNSRCSIIGEGVLAKWVESVFGRDWPVVPLQLQLSTNIVLSVLQSTQAGCCTSLRPCRPAAAGKTMRVRWHICSIFYDLLHISEPAMHYGQWIGRAWGAGACRCIRTPDHTRHDDQQQPSPDVAYQQQQAKSSEVAHPRCTLGYRTCSYKCRSLRRIIEVR